MVYVGYMSFSCQSFKSHCPHNDIGDGMGKYMLNISQCKDVCTDIYMYSYSYGIIVQHSPWLSSLKFHTQAQRLVGSAHKQAEIHSLRHSNLVFQYSGGMLTNMLQSIHCTIQCITIHRCNAGTHFLGCLSGESPRRTTICFT